MKKYLGQTIVVIVGLALFFIFGRGWIWLSAFGASCLIKDVLQDRKSK